MEKVIRVNIKILRESFTVTQGGQRVRREVDIPDSAARIIGVQVFENPVSGTFKTDFRRYGVGPAGQNTALFLQSLTREYMLESSDYFEATAGATEKLYYGQPKRLGAVTFEYGGLTGGFLPPATISVTENGVTEDWYLWESTTLNLGDTIVHVIQPQS